MSVSNNGLRKTKGGESVTRFGKIFNSKAFKYTVTALWLAIILVCVLTMRNLSVDQIINFTPKNPFGAVCIMMLLFALKSLSVVMYSGVLFAALGIMFELPYALPLSILGCVVMASLPYAIGRMIGAGQIEKIEAKYPRFSILQEMRRENDFLFVLLARLLGVLPFDVVSIYMGAAEVKYKTYLPASVLGMLQLALPMTIMGSAVDDPSSPEFIISLCVQIGTSLISFAVLFILIRKMRAAKRKSENC